MRAQKDRHRTQLHKEHTHPRTLNWCCCCCWAGEGQTAVGSILHVASDRCDRVALKLGARTHLLLLPLFFSCCCRSSALLLRLLPLPNAPWGHFWYILFLLFVYFFSTCTKHLPSIFADTFYTQSTFSLPPLCLFWQFVQLLVVVIFALDVYLSVYAALLFPPFNGLFCLPTSTLADWLRQESLFVGINLISFLLLLVYLL